MTDLLPLLVGVMLVNNLVLTHSHGLGLPGRGGTLEAAMVVAAVTSLVLLLSAVCTHLLYHYLLQPFALVYLRTITGMIVIVAVATFSVLLLQQVRLLQAVHSSFMLLIAANSAVPAVALMNDQRGNSLVESVLYGFNFALGFSLLLILFTALRQRIAVADLPAPLQGSAITLVTAALVSLALMGLVGLV